jgi:hypothetical protein
MKLIKSCKECKLKCCKFGPGPYKLFEPAEFFKIYENAEAYNTKCSYYLRSGKCKAWGTSKLPQECRSHMCHLRSFTKKELDIISRVCEGPCENCGALYLLETQWDDIYDCEICGSKNHYTVSVTNDV